MIKFLLQKKIIIDIIFGIILYLLAVAAGQYLVIDDSLSKSDVIVVVSGGDTRGRTEEGVKLYNEGLARYLIFSGAAIDGGQSNAVSMKKIAIDMGIPEAAIITDSFAINTLENAQNSLNIFKNFHFKSIILVTSDYHQRRAYITFHKVLGDNIELINHPAKSHHWSKYKWPFGRFGWQITLSEYFKIIAIRLTDRLS